MHSWEVLCVEFDDESAFDDCRQITQIGIKVAENLQVEPVDKVAIQLNSDKAAYHIAQDDREIHLQGIVDGADKYVRTLDEDRSNDPLLRLPTVDEYQKADRFTR